VVYRCPRTGLKVQGWFTNEVSAKDEATYEVTYEGLKCPACARVHPVNRATGRVLGQR